MCLLKGAYVHILLAKFIVKKYIFHAKEGVFREAAHNKYYPIISQNTEPFINNYISREETLRYPRIKRGSCDCILVGSDQIWRRIYHKKISVNNFRVIHKLFLVLNNVLLSFFIDKCYNKRGFTHINILY